MNTIFLLATAVIAGFAGTALAAYNFPFWVTIPVAVGVGVVGGTLSYLVERDK